MMISSPSSGCASQCRLVHRTDRYGERDAGDRRNRPTWRGIFKAIPAGINRVTTSALAFPDLELGYQFALCGAIRPAHSCRANSDFLVTSAEKPNSGFGARRR